MAGVTENYSGFEVRSVVRFLQAEGVGRREIHRRLVNVYGQKVFSRKEESVCSIKFAYGRKALNDDQEKHRDRQRTSNTDENCVIVEGLMKKIVSLLKV
jgi:hypothetical protein